MHFYESLQHEYGLLQHAARQLESFFESRKNGTKAQIDPLTAEILAEFLRMQFRDLVRYAKDIDEDYAE